MTQQAPVDDSALKQSYADAYTKLDEENARILLGVKPNETNKQAWLAQYKPPAEGAVAPASLTDVKFTEETDVQSAQYVSTDFPAPKEGDPPKANPITALTKAQSDWNESSLNRNKSTVRGELKQSGDTALLWINSKIKQIEGQIAELKAKLPNRGKAGLVTGGLQVINSNGVTVTEDDLLATPGMCDIV
jgi:hypothetical protein